MDARIALGGLAVLAAFGCGLLLAWSAAAVTPHRAAAAAFGGNTARSGRLAWRLRHGVGWTRGLARRALRSKRVAGLTEEAIWVIRTRGYETSAEPLLSVFIAAAVFAGVASGGVARSPVCGAAVTACLCAVVVTWLNAVRDKRRETLREAVPDALRSMGVCFQSGLSLMQTLAQVAGEAKGPLRSLFERAVHRLETGGSVEDALRALRGGALVPELAFVAVALDVQHQAGGSMRQVLDAARETVEGEMELRRSLRVQTAQAKLSARIVSVMPFALIALFSLVSEGFLEPFFASPWGLALLAVAIGMQAAGIAVVRRMLAVEVD